MPERLEFLLELSLLPHHLFVNHLLNHLISLLLTQLDQRSDLVRDFVALRHVLVVELQLTLQGFKPLLPLLSQELGLVLLIQLPVGQLHDLVTQHRLMLWILSQIGSVSP